MYQTKAGSWYFRKKDESGDSVRQALNFECYRQKDAILNFMELYGYDYCLFRAMVEDYIV